MEKLKSISAIKLYLFSIIFGLLSAISPDGSVLYYTLGAIGFALFIIAIVQYFRV